MHTARTNPKIIYMNTANRPNGVGSSSACTVDLRLPYNTWDRVCLMQASIPKSWYLISAARGNNSFVYQEAGQPARAITLPDGGYNKVSMCIILTGLLQAATTFGPAAFTVSYPNNQSQADTFKLSFRSTSTVVATLTFQNSLATILGFVQGVAYTFTSLAPLTAPNAYNFSNTTRIFLKSNLAPDADGSILQEIFQSCPDQSVVSYNQLEVEYNSKTFLDNASDSFSFSLQDQNGLTIQMNGIDWVCSLLFYCASDTDELIRNDILLRTLAS